jgi:1A family penicillin-binding protein
MGQNFLRGEWDPRRVEQARDFARRVRSRVREAAGVDDHTDGPMGSMDTTSALHHAGLVAGVVLLAALVLAALAIPGAAVLGRSTGHLARRFASGIGTVRLPAIARRSVVLATDGRQIATLAGEENRMVVPLSRVPVITQEAVLAIEDAKFYEHHGVDVQSLLRALVSNVKAGRVREGGSTITQQLVKNVLLGSERTFDRKIREAQLAVALERRIGSKRKILELYLNEVYFGSGVYGIGTAAEYYFGLEVAELTLPQSALLAGLIKAPQELNPLRHPEKARARRELVLKRMADESYITRQEAGRAAATPLGVAAHPLPKPRDPFFVEFIKAQILDDPRFGSTRADRARALFQGGLQIETTLDLRLQVVARRAVADVLDEPDDPAAALVSIDSETGAVRAMVGGRDFRRAKYNLAVQGKRQAGSAFKPFTLVAALDNGISPTLTLNTPSPIRIRDARNGQVWPVQNYSHHSEGRLDMRRATELSVNTYYAQLINKVGPEKVVEAAHRMGIESELRPYLSLALGTFSVSPYEMASAYATLANQGTHCQPYAITRVTNAEGREIVRNDATCERALDESVAAQATSILHGVIERGTGRNNGQIGRPAAGKTGTTDNYADAWFAGYTPQVSTVVWLGYPENTKRKLYNIHGLPRVFGGSLPAQIWNIYMRAAHEGLAVEQFPKPPPPPIASVPSVVGTALADAAATLGEAGFSARPENVRSPSPAGTVIGQDPPPGSQADRGSNVTLFVSDGQGAAQQPAQPSPSESPSPPPEPSTSPSASPSPSPSPSTSPSPSPKH